MAESIIPQSPEIRFTATRGVYRFASAATVLDLEDQLSAKQNQLHAMLSVAAESRLDCLSGSLPGYFWACRVAAEEIADLTAEILRRRGAQS